MRFSCAPRHLRTAPPGVSGCVHATGGAVLIPPVFSLSPPGEAIQRHCLSPRSRRHISPFVMPTFWHSVQYPAFGGEHTLLQCVTSGRTAPQYPASAVSARCRARSKGKHLSLKKGSSVKVTTFPQTKEECSRQPVGLLRSRLHSRTPNGTCCAAG